MVREENNLFVCEACGMKYADGDIAKKCEDFCRMYNACNPELIEHAVE